LLHELAAVIRQETQDAGVLILDADSPNSNQRIVVSHGLDQDQTAKLAATLGPIRTDQQLEPIAKRMNATVINLKPGNAPHATVIISPRRAAQLEGGLSLEPLLRIVEWEWTSARCASEIAAARALRNQNWPAPALCRDSFTRVRQ